VTPETTWSVSNNKARREALRELDGRPSSGFTTTDATVGLHQRNLLYLFGELLNLSPFQRV
jgi:hypothetical protein